MFIVENSKRIIVMRVKYIYRLLAIVIVLGLTLLASKYAPVRAAAVFEPQNVGYRKTISGLIQPIFIANAGDGSGRIFIGERAGRIRIYKNGVVLVTPFLDIRSLVNSAGSERGLLSLAFHPNYESNGLFFTVHTDQNGTLVLSKFTRSSTNPDLADAGSRTILLTIPHPTYQNHNGGTLAFGPDGYLYWSTGDGGGAGDPQNNAQNLGVLLGKILRIDVDSGSPYSIPASNPFYNSPGSSVRKEIWAYGLRNPWRFSFDRLTGDMFIGDVGQNAREEIDFQSAASPGGENYGWRVMEGTLCYNPPSGCDQSEKVLPVIDYDHSLGCSVTGGYVYRGTLYPSMQGRYFYSDICSGIIFSLYNDPVTGWTGMQVDDTPHAVSTFGEDEQGELYFTDYWAGEVYQICYGLSESPTCEPSIISGNVGVAGATLNYSVGTARTSTSSPDGGYSLLVPYGWTGTVTPSKACYIFSPLNMTYNNVISAQSNQNYSHVIDTGAGCASIAITIGENLMGEYGIPVEAQQRVEYALDSGPVQVVSTTGKPIIAALRDSWYDSTTSTWTSFVQMMGLPKEQLSDSYYFPSYNNISLSGQLRFGNVDTVGTWVRVVIGGVERGRYFLDPNEQARVEYDLDSGPVVVESETAGVKIIAALRDAWWDGTRWTSFSQMMGLPKEQLSDSYYFPSYNNISLSGQLRFGNVDTVGTWVRVVIGGVERGRYFLDPSEQARVEYDLDSGPVVVESETPGVKIIAALRDSWYDGKTWTSFVQVRGLPKESLSDTYYLPAYNNVSLSGQLRFGNVDTVGTWVRVVIGGVERGRYFLEPNEQQRVEYALDSGPVVIESETTGVQIIAALRDSWYDGVRWTSFAQLMGLPALSDTYYFPSYNNVSLSGQLRFGVP
jgi:glucose/arabinose dehydrogenase